MLFIVQAVVYLPESGPHAGFITAATLSLNEEVTNNGDFTKHGFKVSFHKSVLNINDQVLIKIFLKKNFSQYSQKLGKVNEPKFTTRKTKFHWSTSRVLTADEPNYLNQLLL